LGQGDTAITIPPFFKDAGRGKKRIWGDDTETPQPVIINWPGLNEKEISELIPTLLLTDNWILLTKFVLLYIHTYTNTNVCMNVYIQVYTHICVCTHV